MTRPTEDLNDNAAWPFLDGASEMTIRIRVGRYEEGNPDKGIACYQCWIDPRDGTMPRAVGIRSNPVPAIQAAIREFERLQEDRDVSKKTDKATDSVPLEVQTAQEDYDIEDLLG